MHSFHRNARFCLFSCTIMIEKGKKYPTMIELQTGPKNRNGGEGVGPTPPSLFFLKGGHPPTRVSGQVGGTPLPLRSRPGPATTILKNHQKPRFTPVIPRETQGSAMQKMNRSAAMGGRGVGPTPPRSFFKMGVTPPPVCPGRWGVPTLGIFLKSLLIL